MKINTLASWVQVVWFSFVSLGTLYGGLKFWFKFRDKLDNLENYTYKRNGGGSIMDALARIEARNERQDQALTENTRLTLETVKSLSKLEGRFNNHIEEGVR